MASAQLHATKLFRNAAILREFRQEARYMRQWYRRRKQHFRFRRGIVRRQGESELVPGCPGVWTAKVEARYKMLLWPVRLDGALALADTGASTA